MSKSVRLFDEFPYATRSWSKSWLLVCAIEGRSDGTGKNPRFIVTSLVFRLEVCVAVRIIGLHRRAHPVSGFPEVSFRPDLDKCATRAARLAHEITQPTIRSIEAGGTVVVIPAPGTGNCVAPAQRLAGQTQRRPGFHSTIPIPPLHIQMSGRQPRLPPVRAVMLCRASLAIDHNVAWLQANPGRLCGRYCHE